MTNYFVQDVHTTILFKWYPHKSFPLAYPLVTCKYECPDSLGSRPRRPSNTVWSVCSFLAWVCSRNGSTGSPYAGATTVLPSSRNLRCIHFNYKTVIVCWSKSGAHHRFYIDVQCTLYHQMIQSYRYRSRPKRTQKLSQFDQAYSDRKNFTDMNIVHQHTQNLWQGTIRRSNNFGGRVWEDYNDSTIKISNRTGSQLTYFELTFSYHCLPLTSHPLYCSWTQVRTSWVLF